MNQSILLQNLSVDLFKTYCKYNLCYFDSDIMEIVYAGKN